MKSNKISYWLNCNNTDELTAMYLELLDIMKCKNNIIIIFRRVPNYCNEKIKCFAQTNLFAFTKDTIRDDCCAIYISSLDNNLVLYDLLKNMDEQTEWIYIPNINDISTCFFNRQNIETHNAVYSKVASIQVNYDGDYGIHIVFADDIMKPDFFSSFDSWERTLEKRGCTYKKTFKAN